MVHKVTKYITKDGKEFFELEDAVKHEAKEQEKPVYSYNKYLHTYAGTDLLKKHKLETEGIWRISSQPLHWDCRR